MSEKYVKPNESIQGELNAAVERIFPEHFEEWNVHPDPVSISYSFKSGVWSATVELNWQRKPDYKDGRKLVGFKYARRSLPTGHEMFWYCTSGAPGD